MLRPDAANLPPRLQVLIDRLADQDRELAPSIVPDLDGMIWQPATCRTPRNLRGIHRAQGERTFRRSASFGCKTLLVQSERLAAALCFVTSRGHCKWLVGPSNYRAAGGPAKPAGQSPRKRTRRSNIQRHRNSLQFSLTELERRLVEKPDRSYHFTGKTGIGIAADSWLGISVAQFGSSAAGTMYFDTGGVFFRDETVFLSPRKHPETYGWISLAAASRGWPKCNSFSI